MISPSSCDKFHMHSKYLILGQNEQSLWIFRSNYLVETLDRAIQPPLYINGMDES